GEILGLIANRIPYNSLVPLSPFSVLPTLFLNYQTTILPLPRPTSWKSRAAMKASTVPILSYFQGEFKSNLYLTTSLRTPNLLRAETNLSAPQTSTAQRTVAM